MKKRIMLALACAFISCLALSAQENTGRPIKEAIEDKAIVYPESMTENLSKLLHDWQIDLTKSDNACRNGQNVLFHDSVYTRRLHAMPSIMELSFNQVVKSHIEMYAGRRRDQVGYMLALGNYYFPMFEEALDRYNMPLELKYLPVIESALNPVAVSRVGATGLWQFMLRTGQGYGLEVNSLVDERRDPYKATEAAVRYLRDLYLIYSDWNLVIAAYNCGPGNVNKAIARSGGKRDYWEIYYHLPRETRGYVPAFIAANYIMNHYGDHNICPMSSYSDMVGLDTVHVSNQVHFSQIADVLDIPLSEIRRLNPQFKKDIVPGNFKPYALVLPTNKMVAFIDKQDEIFNHKKNTYFAERANTDSYLRETDASGYGGNTQNVYYRVKRGDNLSAIARRNGVSVAQLRSWNGLRNNKISVGKRLVVKKRTIAAPRQELATAQTSTSSDGNVTYEIQNKYYKVRKGDTLGAIAGKNGVTVAQLRSWNGLRSNNIAIGKNLVVSQKRVAVAAPKPAVQETHYNRAESASSQSGGNIISDYLKEQKEKVERRKTAHEEASSPQEVSSESDSGLEN